MESDNAGSLIPGGSQGLSAAGAEGGGLVGRGVLERKGLGGSLRVGRGRIGGCWGAGKLPHPLRRQDGWNGVPLSSGYGEEVWNVFLSVFVT